MPPTVTGVGRPRALMVALALLVLVGCDAEPPQQPAAGPTSSTAPGGVSAEVVARYEPGPLPGPVRSRVQSMLDVRSPGSGVLTPDGTRMFFSWSVTGSSQVWRLDGPGRFPIQMTGGEDATKVAGVLADGRHIVVSRDEGGAENPGLYLQPADGGALQTIFHKEKVQALFQFAGADGRSVYYSANDSKPDSRAIYRFDVTTGQSESVFAEDGLWFVADHRPDGRMLLGKETGNTSREYFDFDPATKALTARLGQNEREDYDAAYGPGDGELLVLTPKLGDFRRLYRYRQGDFTPVTPEMAHDVAGFSIDDGRHRILYTVNDGGYTRLRALDATTFGELALPALPAADHVTSGSTTPDGRYTTISVDEARAPSASSVLDWKTGQLTRWHVPSAPEVDTATFAVATLESYPARDGTPIPMFVRRPASCSPAPCPVVVSFHGGPESQATPGFYPSAQLFVDAGFVFVEPNVRGSEGYGKAWLHADDGPKRLGVVTDIEDCAKFIRAHFGADGREPKLGIYGASYGGYSTLIGMTMFAGAFDAGASVVGIANLVTFLENTAPYRRPLRVTEYGDPERDRDALVKLSPVTYVDRVKGPLLVIQGANDPRVPPGEAVQIHDALAARKVDSTLILLPDEGHGSQKRDNRVIQLGHVLAFFTDHLGPRPS